MQGFLAIGRILRPQGRKGEVVAEMLTDFPSRFQSGQRVFVEVPGQKPAQARLEFAWLHKGKVVLKFPGVNSIEAAEELRGRCVFVSREEAVVLPAGQYYIGELKGCQVVVEREGSRKSVGRVVDVEPTGGVDLLRVADGPEETLIPLAQSICKVIDLEARVIVIDPPEDLLDINKE